jgi:hypothetical protein
MHDSHRLVQPQRRHDLIEERHTPRQRLDQVDPQVGAAARHRNPWQPGPAPDVDDPGTRRHKLGDHGAVEQVPFPEPGNFTRAEQPAEHPVRRKPLPERYRQRQPFTEDLGRSRRRSWQ